jgi:hypothetical protein
MLGEPGQAYMCSWASRGRGWTSRLRTGGGMRRWGARQG